MSENILGAQQGCVAEAPIGVYDSGLGGLSVAAQIRALMPCEDIVYYADTARVPYGDRPRWHIRRFALEITRLLVAEGTKALAVACNTSSALALDVVEAAARGLPVTGVIGPGARAAVSASRSGVIGVIATAATVRSGAYSSEIRSVLPAARVVEVACPELVPMVEDGRIEGPEVEEMLWGYLEPVVASGADTLVLGCTHYPLLRGTILAVLGRLARAAGTGGVPGGARRAGPTAVVVDPAYETARVLRLKLVEAGLERKARGTAPGRDRFVVSGDPARFARMAEAVSGRRIAAGSVVRAAAGEDPWVHERAEARQRKVEGRRAER